MITIRANTEAVGAAAVTVWPFVFVSKRLSGKILDDILRHESVHCEQQRRWFLRGAGVGLLAWFTLYLLCLPFWRNPWREKWEREAYRRGEGYSDLEIDRILVRSPYYLWGLTPTKEKERHK